MQEPIRGGNLVSQDVLSYSFTVQEKTSDHLKSDHLWLY